MRAAHTMNLALMIALIGILCAAVVGAAAFASTPAPSVSPTSAERVCPVTLPDDSAPPKHGNYGTDQISTGLWPDGRVIFEPGGSGSVEPDGSLGMKWWWWRGVRGYLTIQGQRLDEAAPPLRSVVPDGYGDKGFQASGLIFPTPGCWEVTGRVGEASLTFVTLVVVMPDERPRDDSVKRCRWPAPRLCFPTPATPA